MMKTTFKTNMFQSNSNYDYEHSDRTYTTVFGVLKK